MTYMALSLPPFQRSLTNSATVDMLMLLGTLAWGVAIMWSRIYLGYHTWQQVAVGGAIGFCGGALWRFLWNAVVLPRSLESPLQQIVDQGFAILGC